MRGGNRLLLVFALIIVVVVAFVLFVLVRGSSTPPAPTDTGVAPGAQPLPTTPAVIVPPTPAQVSVVVAARALPPGTQLRADDLDVITKPKSEVNEADDITQ